MKLFAFVVVAALILIGCGGPSDTTADQAQTSPPQQMPTAVGVTAGETGTGTTSGASTGY